MATRAVKEVVVMGGGLMGTGIAQVLVFRRNDQSGVRALSPGGSTGTAEGGPGRHQPGYSQQGRKEDLREPKVSPTNSCKTVWTDRKNSFEASGKEKVQGRPESWGSLHCLRNGQPNVCHQVGAG